MEAVLAQLTLHHAELALRMVVGVVLAGAVGMAAGSGMHAVSVFIATLSFAILYGLRKSPHRRLSDAHPRAEDGEKLAKESQS